jgi:DNA-binding response OmpR family regulator
MLIIVASKNIFRRELTSYTLIEAGHDVREIVEVDQIASVVGREQPAAIVADASMADPEPLLHMVRQHSAAPLLWMERSAAAHSAALTCLDWPYRPDELLAAIVHLSVHDIPATLPSVAFT